MDFPDLDRLGAIRDLASGESWSRSRLASEVERRAARLARLGLAPGHRALILHGQEPRFFADLLAVWRVGACAAILDSGCTESERANIRAFLRPDLELAHGAESGPLRLPPPGAQRAALPGDPALILFTSGSTGEPKGVVHSFRSLRSRLRLNRAVIGDARLARTLCFLPTHFGHGLIGNSLTPLLHGHTLLLARFGGELVGDLDAVLAREGVTFLSSVPAMWRRILDECPAPLAERPNALARVHVGSAPLSEELWRGITDWCGTRDVVNTYGITEAANWIAGASAAEQEPADGLIGRAWGGELGVRDDAGTVRPTGEGELVVRSRALMTGYLERPELSAEVLEGGWFRTGDLGRIDEAGRARLVGRLKNEINRGGTKIQPEDVDLVVERFPEVAECCTFGIPDERLGERVAAAVRARSEILLHSDALEAFCRRHLRRHAVPEHWYFLDEIPKTDRGKVQRALVRDHCLRLDDELRSRKGAS